MVTRSRTSPRSLVVSLVALIAASITLPPAVAGRDDCVLITGGRIYASDDGTTGFRMTVSRSRADGELFTFDEAGKERRLWKARLVTTPVRVLVPPSGPAVVTIDMACRMGYEHSLVVYGEGGRVVADYTLDDLLSPDEIQENVKRSISSRWWTEGTTFSFDPRYKRLQIRFAWGRERSVDLVTGKILEP